MKYKIIDLTEVPKHMILGHLIAWNALHYESGQSEYAAILDEDFDLFGMDTETGGDWGYQTQADLDRLVTQIKEQEQ
jgi:hypothetical protein